MCGIIGYWSSAKSFHNLESLHAATNLIAHRGPDDEGYTVFHLQNGMSVDFSGPDSSLPLKSTLPLVTRSGPIEHHLAFGFRRFSIVDLTDKGHQPFWNLERNLCLIFNGEVYNYVEIRRQLQQEGCRFMTESDTEVLLSAYQHWGTDFLTRCNGPIAAVIYDKRKSSLFLCRDRIGKSPLYYAIRQGVLYWASEIKSILSMAGWDAFKVNEQAVYDYLVYGWRDLDNQTFWEGIFTFPAASWVEFNLNKTLTYDDILTRSKRYWNIPEQRDDTIAFAQAKERFIELFEDGLRIRARADAKVAFSLSGGLDSSSIVATAASDRAILKPLRTYSIKFPGEIEDEEPLARSVAELYSGQIDYQTYTPDKSDFWNVADDYIWLQEEPFHYPNAELFQAYLRKARQDGYKVMITGAGGDELLAGYPDFFWPFLMHLQQKTKRVTLTANILLKTDLWKKYGFQKRGKLLYGLLCGDGRDAAAHIPISFFNSSGHQRALDYIRDPQLPSRVLNRTNYPASFNGMMVGYMTNWLMNYWLRNSNKSHFGVPMESRSPFLDYRLIDFVFSLPPEYLICRGWSKFLLRKTMTTRLPSQVIWNRTKKGFPFNTQTWFSHSKPIVRRHLIKITDNPYLDVEKLLQDYDNLTVQDPLVLWRCINLGIWWHRVVQKNPLV